MKRPPLILCLSLIAVSFEALLISLEPNYHPQKLPASKRSSFIKSIDTSAFYFGITIGSRFDSHAVNSRVHLSSQFNFLNLFYPHCHSSPLPASPNWPSQDKRKNIKYFELIEDEDGGHYLSPHLRPPRYKVSFDSRWLDVQNLKLLIHFVALHSSIINFTGGSSLGPKYGLTPLPIWKNYHPSKTPYGWAPCDVFRMCFSLAMRLEMLNAPPALSCAQLNEKLTDKLFSTGIQRFFPGSRLVPLLYSKTVCLRAWNKQKSDFAAFSKERIFEARCIEDGKPVPMSSYKDLDGFIVGAKPPGIYKPGHFFGAVLVVDPKYPPVENFPEFARLMESLPLDPYFKDPAPLSTTKSMPPREKRMAASAHMQPRTTASADISGLLLEEAFSNASDNVAEERALETNNNGNSDDNGILSRCTLQ